MQVVRSNSRISLIEEIPKVRQFHILKRALALLQIQIETNIIWETNLEIFNWPLET